MLAFKKLAGKQLTTMVILLAGVQEQARAVRWVYGEIYVAKDKLL